ncbi:MAG: PRC-barrel domain-containing protein [Cyanobacteria bacterium SID2]|nr:PRC-barrel domain-containing protein [Cyanobacteria bacterium SID2]MBP0005534.1 PRC-barrel domain-containing protein [Cyanobacteria bacterium SBC]
MTSEHIRQRSDLLGTQVITRDSGKRLGVVSQLWVDIDRRQVVALGMRENILAVAGLPRYMQLDRIRQIGDVILVDNQEVIEDDLDVEPYSNLINSEVITETGEPLGRVRGFKFDTRDGQVASIIIASLGLPQIPEQLLSTYELPIEEIVSSGPNRLIVFEGAEERLTQLSVGVMERLGLGTAPWEREEEEEFYTPTARPENQLGSGIPVSPPERRRPAVQPPVESQWDEDEWTQPEPEPIYREEPEPVYVEYEEAEETNWSEASRSTYETSYPEEPYRDEPIYEEAEYPEYAAPTEYEDVEADAWADDEDRRSYNPPKVNIPQKAKQPEYEEEAGY